jgi:hypothetical protein
VGWLNSRSGKVGRDMEAELWSKAKSFLETVEGLEHGQRRIDEKSNDVEKEDEEMAESS